MVFRILGPLELRDRGAGVHLPNRRKQRLLLAALLLRPNTAVTVDGLIDILWSDSPPRSAVANLHSHISQLRRLLAAVAPTDTPRPERLSGAYLLPLYPGELDAEVFEQLAGEGRQTLANGQPSVAVDLLSQALRMWRGPVLDRLDLPAQLRAGAARLEEARLSAGEDLVDARMALGQHRELVTELSESVDQYPLRERMWSQLLLVLHRSGRRTEALETYDRACDALDRELGVPPGASLRSLYQQIRDDEPALSLSSPTATPRQLPFESGDFTGREPELRELDGGAGDPEASAARLVVVTGLAGVGKTALVVRWAHRAAGAFPDGQLFVDLRGYSADPALRPIDALAQLLGGLGAPAEKIPVTEAESAAFYRSMLAGKRVLVVLDNVRDVAQVRPLLPGSANAAVVITSRERLAGLTAREGAHRIDLAPLDPADAVGLLRTVLGAPRADAEPSLIAELAALCAYTPLALRIAATKVVDDPYQSLDGLVRQLREGDRLASLEVAGDPHTAIGAAFDLSYERLDPLDRRLFRLLGVAPVVDVTPAAAAAILDTSCGRAQHLLNRLAAVHLLTRCGSDRFTFHDLLRLHARARAEREEGDDECAGAVRRLLEWYRCRLEEVRALAYPDMLRMPAPPLAAAPVGPTLSDLSSALAWCDAERRNLITAIRHTARSGPAEMSWLLADGLRGYLYGSWLVTDLFTVGEAGLAAAEEAGALPAMAAMQFCLANAYHCAAQRDLAIEHSASAVELARKAGWVAAVAGGLTNLGVMHAEAGRLSTAVRYHSESAELQEQHGNRALLAVTRINLAHAYGSLGQITLAAQHLEAALEISRMAGSPVSEGLSLANLGHAYRLLGEWPRAIGCLHDALRRCRDLGDRRTEVFALYILAQVHRDLGDYPEALTSVQTGLDTAAEIGYPHGEALGRNVEATIRLELGPYPPAAVAQEAAARLMGELDDRHNETSILIDLARTHCRTGDPGRALDIAARARTQAQLGGFRLLEACAGTAMATAELALDRPGEAIGLARPALALHVEARHRMGEADTSTIIGDAAWQLGQRDVARAAWLAARTVYEALGSARAGTLAARPILSPPRHDPLTDAADRISSNPPIIRG